MRLTLERLLWMLNDPGLVIDPKAHIVVNGAPVTGIRINAYNKNLGKCFQGHLLHDDHPCVELVVAEIPPCRICESEVTE